MATVQQIEVRDTLARAAASNALTSGTRESDEVQDLTGEKMVLNMGPSHPSTHGVLRIILEMDGGF